MEGFEVREVLDSRIDDAVKDFVCWVKSARVEYETESADMGVGCILVGLEPVKELLHGVLLGAGIEGEGVEVV